MRNFFASFSGYDLAVDLGSEATRIMVRGKGLIVDEPTVVARQKKRLGEGSIVTYGQPAAQMAGRQPAGLEVVFPIRNGVIVDFKATYKLLDHFLQLVRALPSRWPKLLGPRVIAGISSTATEVERRAVKALWRQLGAREIFLVSNPLLAAIGAGLAVAESSGGFLIDMGAMTTEIAIISLGGIVVGRCLAGGGEKADQSLLNFLRLKYGLLIGRPTARRLKEKIGTLAPQDKEANLVVRGRDISSGLPRSLRLQPAEVREALAPLAQEIIAAAREVLEEAPPELTPNFLEQGLFLSGGFSLLPGWLEVISQELKMPVWRVEKPQLAIARGGVKLWEKPDLLSRVKLVSGLK